MDKGIEMESLQPEMSDTVGLIVGALPAHYLASRLNDWFDYHLRFYLAGRALFMAWFVSDLL